VKDFRWHKTTHSPNWYEITPTPAIESAKSDSLNASDGNVPQLEETTESAVVKGGVSLCGFEGGSGTNTATCSTAPAAVEEDDEM